MDINLLAAWDRMSTIGDSRITVAVFDSGIEDCNPDFDPERFLPSELSYTCEGNCSYAYPCCPSETTTPCTYGAPTDNYGHGTFVASIIGAVADNGIGMTGIDQQCKLLAARVYNPCGAIGPSLPESVAYGRVILAFEEIYANSDYDSVRVINCSFTLPYIAPNPNPSPLITGLENAINAVVGQHRFVVAGAGNYGSTQDYAIQRMTLVYTVGGMDSRGWRVDHPHSIYYSSTGSSLDFMAPGMAEIGLTAQRSGCTPASPPQPSCPYTMYGSEFAVKHNFLMGTSYAGPKVAAAISLILAHAIALDIIDPEGNWSELDFADMYEILQAGCRDKVSWQDYPTVLGDSEDLVGWDDHYGWGLVDIDASLQYLEDNW